MRCVTWAVKLGDEEMWVRGDFIKSLVEENMMTRLKFVVSASRGGHQVESTIPNYRDLVSSIKKLQVQ